MQHSDGSTEIEELRHDSWPGYDKKFSVISLIGIVYLIYIFFSWKGH